jgi:hypothetical protein
MGDSASSYTGGSASSYAGGSASRADDIRENDCEIGGFCDSDCGDYCVLGCHAVKFSEPMGRTASIFRI